MKIININKLLLGILFLSFCIPQVNFITIGTQNIKMFRVITVLYFLMLIISKKKIEIPSKKIFFFLLYMIGLSLICSFNFGFERLLFDYIFAFLVLIVVYNFGNKLNMHDWVEIIQYVSIIAMFIVVTNILRQSESFIYFVQSARSQHPNYNSIFTGGANLEATWLAMFSVFFLNKPMRGYVYLILTTVISMLLSSRVGIIIDFIGFAVLSINVLKYHTIHNKKRIIAIMIILIPIVVVLLTHSGIADNIISRLSSIGKDGGSQGRLKIWKYIKDAFLSNPFGYGVGNAMGAIRSVSSEWYGEDNVHNLFFQMLLDLGFIGFIWYSIMIFKFIKKEIKNVFVNPIITFLFIYILISFIQFKGAEIITFYMLAIYLNNNKRKEFVVNEK